MSDELQHNPPTSQPPQARMPSAGIGFSLNETPGIELLLQPLTSTSPIVNEAKIRRLYLQASTQQWFSPHRLNFSDDVEMDEVSRRIWIRFMTVFYTMEKMGLNVIQNMMSRAVRKMKSEEMAYYLSVQCADEARHVFTIEQYLKKLGAPPKYDYTYHVLGQAASMGIYRVENWLFSTLFSENFASCFLRKTRASNIEPMGNEMCKYLLIDESRHLHFLHIVLPDVMDRLSLFGKAYVKGSQFFIMKFTELMARKLDKDGKIVGIDRRELVEEVFENVERAYESFGVSRRFLPFPRVGALTSN